MQLLHKLVCMGVHIHVLFPVMPLVIKHVLQVVRLLVWVLVIQDVIRHVKMDVKELARMDVKRHARMDVKVVVVVDVKIQQNEELLHLVAVETLQVVIMVETIVREALLVVLVVLQVV